MKKNDMNMKDMKKEMKNEENNEENNVVKAFSISRFVIYLLP